MKILVTDQAAWGDLIRFMEARSDTVGPLGDVTKGEIQIVTDPEQVQQCFEAERSRVLKLVRDGGLTVNEAWIDAQAQPGIVYQDRYATLVRYPVFFPGALGKPPVPGTYLVWYWGGFPGPVSGACSMPVMPDGKIVMAKMYRHATRSWSLEFPRGGISAVTSINKVLAQELKEETGLEAGEMISLGSMEPDTGILGQRAPVSLVRVVGAPGKATPEFAEVIGGLVFFTPKMLESVLQSQEWQEQLSDESVRTYSVRGAFENFAFNQAKLRGLI